ncbi:MAG TPA: TPM domain-containing protein [Nitrospiraceae bacterium]
MTKIVIMLLVLGLVLFEGLAQAVGYDRPKIQLPEPRGYVSDHAQVIDGDWKERIRSVCQDLERKTGVEMVVVTVPTIKPFGSANEYATALYEKWGIGSTQQEHGVMVLVAVQERQAAMTLGRQMMPVITPTLMNQVAHESLQPSIELGHFGEGLYRTVVALASPAQEVRVGGIANIHFKGLGFWLALFTAIGALSFFWWISRPDLRHPYRRIQKGEYWGTGQGGFGGNFGGFGGGTSGEGWK